MTDSTPVVLVVDDHRELADLYSVWLSEAYRVRTAYHGEQALDLIDADVDAVFMDRDMPGMRGEAVLRRIRERGFDCRVTLVTTNDPELNVAELDVDAYLTKPVSADVLTEVADWLITSRTADGSPTRDSGKEGATASG